MDPAVDPPATAEAHTAHAANATPTLNHTHNHPPYAEMITAAITTLDERKGSSRKAIAKYIEDNYTNLPSTHSALLTHHLKRLKNSGALLMVKHSYKLPRSASAPAQTPSSAKRSRGRPPKPKTDVKPTLVALGLLDEHDSPAKRTPGRPRKSGDSAAATPKAGSGRRPGRPPKTRALMALNSVENKKPRGRPRKEGSSPATVPSRPRGRPPRNAGVGGGDGGGVVGSRRGRALKAVAPKKPKKLGARPIGRPKKNVLSLELPGPSLPRPSLPVSQEDLRAKLEHFQSKLEHAVGVLRPHLANNDAANSALQYLEELATMDVSAPFKGDGQ